MSDQWPAEQAFLTTRAVRLLRQIGFGERIEFHRLSGGRNNRVYRVSGDGPEVVAKWYFHHPQDQRDRLHAEYSLCEFAKDCGAQCVASPLARNDDDRLAIYSAIDGRHLTIDEVDPSRVQEALEFFRILNAHRETAGQLPVASEACFSLQEHVDCVSKRVARLQSVPTTNEIQEAAVELVNQKIVPAFQRAVEELRRWGVDSGVDFCARLPAEARCISPSDFGFHNALVQPDGKLSFIDFEYAGWDDPAKTLCDFYCQPELPAPRSTWNQFADAMAELAADAVLERQRQELLFSLYQVKWCCILLNEFTVQAAGRREFAARQPVDLQQRLDKAKQMAEQLS